ncbi:MAG: SURF1 family protein [Gammaproteobacteria bacterium]|nr:SURF1 family protein [Gammaproteobacteria bacterium]
MALLAFVAAVCTALGFWQLDRAGQSRAVLERYAEARELPPVSRPLDALEPGDAAALRYRSVVVDGRYEPDRQFLIDNIVRDGVPGYLVLTPLRMEDRDARLIVNRGWIRASPDRSVLPAIGVSREPRRVVGRLDELPAPGLKLGGAPAPAADEPVRVLSYPTMAELESELGHRLIDYQLLLDPDQPDGFARDWEGPAADPARNLGYAGQWWLFAAVAAGAAAVIARRSLRRRTR